MESDSAVAARGLICRRRRKWKCDRYWMTQSTKSFARNSTGLLVWRDDLRAVPKIWDGTALVPPALADDFEQFFRLRVLMFRAAIELQIIETAIVAGFGQQLGVGADFFYVAAIHHHDLI